MVWMEGLEPTSNGFVDRCLSVRTPTLIFTVAWLTKFPSPNDKHYLVSPPGFEPGTRCIQSTHADQTALRRDRCRILIIPDTATGIAG